MSVDFEDPQELLEGNKCIAKFMGYRYFGHNDPLLRVSGEVYPAGWKTAATIYQMSKLNRAGGRYLCRTNHMIPYYRDWNALMEVVQRIEEMDFQVAINTNSCLITSRTDTSHHPLRVGSISDTKKKAVWFAVVKLIEKINPS